MDTSEIVIEQAKEFSKEVADAVRSLIHQEGNNFQEFTDEDLHEMVESPQSFLFIARHVPTGKIAGMIMAMIYRIPYVRKAYLDDLVVDESFRKMGIATKLLEHAISVSREHKVAYIMFTAHQSRVASNTLYQKLGFKTRETNVYRLDLKHE
jgi:ribosomal protein S18 acetylase RimI-like enzyme